LIPIQRDVGRRAAKGNRYPVQTTPPAESREVPIVERRRPSGFVDTGSGQCFPRGPPRPKRSGHIDQHFMFRTYTGRSCEFEFKKLGFPAAIGDIRYGIVAIATTLAAESKPTLARVLKGRGFSRRGTAKSWSLGLRSRISGRALKRSHRQNDRLTRVLLHGRSFAWPSRTASLACRCSHVLLRMRSTPETRCLH